MLNTRRRRVRRPIGFTLVELIAVVALVAVLSAVAIPAVGAMMRARQSAAAGEAARLITLARQRAIATGEPTAVEVNIAAQTLTLVRAANDQSPPAPVVDPARRQAYALEVATEFAGAAMNSFSPGGAIWFLSDGSPATRNPDGSFIMIQNDARLTFAGDFEVVVRRSTGAVEK